MLCRVFGGPTYSFTMHGPEEFDAPRANCLCEKIRRARFVVAISEFARSQLYRWADYHDWAKIHVIHCGVGPRAIDRLILGKLGNRLCRAGRSISPGNTSLSSRMETFTEGSLLAFLATVPDPRSRHGRRHPLSAILSLVAAQKLLQQVPLESQRVLRHHVWREELRGYRSMGSGPGHHADSPTWLHAGPPSPEGSARC